MKSKLWPHINDFTAGTIDFIIRMQPAGLKTLVAEASSLKRLKEEIPGLQVIYRSWRDPAVQDTYIADPNGGNRFADEICSSAAEAEQYIDIYSGLNEVGIGEQADAYNTWSCQFATKMHQRGYKVGLGDWSVGCPVGCFKGSGDLYPAEWKEGLRQDWAHYHPMLRLADYIFLHEYSAPNLQHWLTWLFLRYRRVWEILPDDCKKPIHLTEFGIDGGVSGGSGGGWQLFLSEQQYLTELQFAEMETAKDPYIQSLDIYCCGVADNKWRSFDILGRNLIADYIKNSSVPEGEPMDYYESIFNDIWKRQGVTPNMSISFCQYCLNMFRTQGRIIYPLPSKDGNYYTKVGEFYVCYTNPMLWSPVSNPAEVHEGIPPFLDSSAYDSWMNPGPP